MILPDECGTRILRFSTIRPSVIGQKTLILCQGMKKKDKQKKRHFKISLMKLTILSNDIRIS